MSSERTLVSTAAVVVISATYSYRQAPSNNCHQSERRGIWHRRIDYPDRLTTTDGGDDCSRDSWAPLVGVDLFPSASGVGKSSSSKWTYRRRVKPGSECLRNIW